MRAPDRELLTVVAELQQAITSGRKPQLTATEWALLTSYIRSKGKPDRRGHSIKRHIQGADRRMLRMQMEWLKVKLRRDPAERELKRTMRANGETYVLNRRVAERMRERLEKSGRKDIPTVEYLENVLSRSDMEDSDKA